jgi:hypothetical protein
VKLLSAPPGGAILESVSPLAALGRLGFLSFFLVRAMSNEGVDRQQQKINEFLRLLPLTSLIAGLPECELGRHFNEGQMDARAITLRTAYKVARQLILDMAK